jgi:hypothetical protein
MSRWGRSGCDAKAESEEVDIQDWASSVVVGSRRRRTSGRFTGYESVSGQFTVQVQTPQFSLGNTRKHLILQ